LKPGHAIADCSDLNEERLKVLDDWYEFFTGYSRDHGCGLALVLVIIYLYQLSQAFTRSWRSLVEYKKFSI
jgi:hypothetical protein